MVLFGTIVEGALQEMERRGPDNAAKWEPKYRLSELLTPGFVLGSSGRADDFDPRTLRGTAGMMVDEV